VWATGDCCGRSPPAGDELTQPIETQQIFGEQELCGGCSSRKGAAPESQQRQVLPALSAVQREATEAKVCET
jgi:hypothetical protein